MQLKRTIFNVDISGTTYRFAERTLREIENLVSQETAAFEEKQYAKLKMIHFDFVLKALNDVPDGEKVTVEDLKDNMGGPTFASLYGAVLGAQGIKLEAKNLGESLPS